MPKKLHIHAGLAKGYGWRRPSLPVRRTRLVPHFEGTIPSRVDLRPGMPKVYDQADLGSCTANALAGLAEFVMMKQGKTHYTPSRLFIYYNERVIEGSVSEDAGAALSDGAYVLEKFGVPNEGKWWYNTAKFRVKPNKSVFAEGTKHLVGGVHAVAQNLDDMRKVLATGYPIAGGFTVYDSFESDSVAKTALSRSPQRTNRFSAVTPS
jgi:C1A family cysteine protease